MATAPDLPPLLTSFRRARHLSQTELARRAGLSVSTVRAYERGARHPKQDALRRIVDGLGLSGEEAAQLLLAAGYSPPRSRALHERYGPASLGELQHEANDRPWPAFVTNQAFEILIANRLFQRLMGHEPSRPYAGGRNLVWAIADDAFARRLENWEEVVRFMIGLVKADPRRRPDDDRPLPWLEGPIQRLIEGRPDLIKRFVDLYEDSPPIPHRLRQHFRIRWRADGGRLLTFTCTLALADIHTELHWNEWVPSDGPTWAAIEALAG
jgi:transcriptional regulator with XRE-family HTH domain